MTTSRTPIALFRAATLLVPTALSWWVALSAERPSALTTAVKVTLAPLWALVACLIVVRVLDTLVRRRRDATPSVLAQLDVLTAAGSSLAWLSAFAIMSSVWLGWASAAVAGLLGATLLHAVVGYTLVVAPPGPRGKVSRRFTPEVPTEGDAVVEELRLDDVRIPAGFRLFATARVAPGWATSRYAVDASESGAEVLLESDLGPARRGEYDAEPLAFWLQDALGLCRAGRFEGAATRLTVLPRPGRVEGLDALLGPALGEREPAPASRLPTEGCFRLRDYQPGDDVRRIHWMRSQAMGEVIVRLPDELPPERPRVRLVLDTCFAGVHALSCDAPAELLDALVCVWLATGWTLARAGTRVTLVCAGRSHDGQRLAVLRHELRASDLASSLRVGAAVQWQDALTAETLLASAASRRPGREERSTSIVVSRGFGPRAAADGARRILVPPSWIGPPWPLRATLPGCMPFPAGSSENRGARVRRARRRVAHAERDHATFLALRTDAAYAPAPPGTFVARSRGDVIRIEAFP